MRDPLPGMLRRIDRYLEQHEVDGVTMDWRYTVIPSEEIRQTVVCQVLGEVELYRVRPTPRRRAQIARHADFLVAHLDQITSGTPFDGMLALSLLAAWEVTGDQGHRAAAVTLLTVLKAIPTAECILNGGLMAAMAMVAEHRLTGDLEARQKAAAILAQLPRYQNEDGSFPHWCQGSEDVHYTGWMGLELVQIERLSGDRAVEPMLARMNTFLETRGHPRDTLHYQAPCGPGCVTYYYSRASGCGFDYDTRGWTVEPAYSAVLFDRFRSPWYLPTMRFLDSLETRGTIPDLWGYWPPPDDPEYPWTIADTSVVNMSIIFWSLATILSGRSDAGALAETAWADDGQPRGDDAARVGAPHDRRAAGLSLAAVSCGDRVELRLELPRATHVELAIYDPAGRHVRALFGGLVAPGVHRFTWDGRERDGVACPSGVYYALARANGVSRGTAFSLVR